MRALITLAVCCGLAISPSYAAKGKQKASQSKKKASRSGQRNRIVEPPMPDANAVNGANWTPDMPEEAQTAVLIRAQVILDRANFSPGEIDGKPGINLARALRGFQGSRGIATTGKLDDATWKALIADGGPALTQYTITPEDVKGPFFEIPKDMMEQANLPALAYASPQEALGEKFHIKPELLSALNPGKSLTNAGEQIMAPVVKNDLAGVQVASIQVDKSDSTVSAVDASGKVVAQFPATIGSEHDPLPIGTWKVTGVLQNPEFHYNPDLFWDAKPGHSKATIKPGPNNPVGVVWIGLTKEHYGIHGTPVPSTIGHTESHGCIRLTNWDAAKLGAAATKGMQVVCKE